MTKPFFSQLALASIAMAVLTGCISTSHTERPADLGTNIDQVQMESMLGQTGIVELQTVESADWVVDLSGMVNLSRPKAKAAKLVERDEPIKVYIHVLRHPTRGLFLVDTGFAEQLVRDPGTFGINKLLQKALNFDRLKFLTGPAEIIKRNGGKLRGVFLTHLHSDHVGGLSEVPLDTPIYSGPGETTERHWTHLFTSAEVDHLMAGRPPLQTWKFPPRDQAVPDPRGSFAIVDIFGDASVFAISTPGHTQGSTAYLVRTSTGPVLLTGDNSHTRWGWDNGVEPGTFTRNADLNLDSLLKLKALVSRHPEINVRLGHQP